MDGGSTEIIGEGSVPDLGDLERWWNDPGIAAWSFALFGCFLLNMTLLLAFLIRPGLRTISNRFVMNLTASNLLTCAVLNPLLIMDASSTSNPSTGSICAISEGATALVTTSSVLSVLLIAVDQYFAVVDPLRYRARVDKLKSGVLIVSVWLFSAIFGFFAFFNPNPRSFWLSCITEIDSATPTSFLLNTSTDALTESSVLQVLENETVYPLSSVEYPRILEAIESFGRNSNLEESASSNGNSKIASALRNDPITYGLIYAAVHSVFAYLLPFAAVCWIYVSIYVAAHRNSERTRRTGSRPILSSASFCEEQSSFSRHHNQQQQASDTIEDLRRIPKISSLSSIDETSETAHSASQQQQQQQPPRRRSFASTSEIDEAPSSGIVFTVGSRKVQVSNQRGSDPEVVERVPVATLKAKFLETDRDSSTYEDLVRSKFHDRPDQRRKSSHDLMYEEMVARETARDATWMSSNSSNAASDSEDESRFECYPSFCEYQSSRIENSLKIADTNEATQGGNESHRVDDSGVKENQSTIKSDIQDENNHGEANLLKIDPKIDFEDRQAKSSSILRHYPMEGRSSRRSSTTFAITDVILNASEGSNSIFNKNGRDAAIALRNNTTPEASTCLLAPIVTITPAPNKNGTLHRVSSVRSTSSYINSLKYRISNGSLFRYREEARAARISALVIVMGLICWTPYVIILTMKNLPRYVDEILPHKYDVMALSFLILAAYVSPLLFGYRSRRVKRELRKFFCFRRELSYKNNRSLMAKKVLKRRHSSTLSHLEMDHKYNIFNCVYGRSRWPKEKVQFVQVPDTALAVETCRSSFSSGASTQISSTSTEEC